MKARAQAKYVRQSPYKVRRVLDLVRGLSVDEARATLDFTNRRAAPTIKKVLESAVANAEHNLAVDADELFIAEAYADEGPTLKRWRPRARGRATRINKRTSHITIVVADEEEFEETEV
jgi:large subunit ribosomal protein L22